MNRRLFARIFGSLAVGAVINDRSALANNVVDMKHTIKPARLKQGDLIRLIAPGSPCAEEKIATAISKLEGQGFRVRYTDAIRKRNGYLAGTDQERIDDLHAAFEDKEARAVWCIRGGYGCTRIIPQLDYGLIKANPKILVGYSDVTALIHAIHQKTGLVGFHGPVGATPQSEYNRDLLERTIVAGENPLAIRGSEEQLLNTDEAYQPYIIRGGSAEGELSGGNLCLLAAMAGTDFGVNFKDKIVFLEEVGEKPYRIDRMVTQLMQSSDLHLAKAIVLGVFEDCQPKNDLYSLGLKETLEFLFKPLGIPVMYGFSFGHVSQICTLPVGIRARFDADRMELTLLESAVS
jgi:muramoyltetrapeptide carboxypeptidase